VQPVGDARLKIYLYRIPPVAVVGITPKLVERLLATSYPNAIAGTPRMTRINCNQN
jgi:4-hydroxy-tetrahydrodipicolinate synthase